VNARVRLVRIPRPVLLAAVLAPVASCTRGSDALSVSRFAQCGQEFQNLMTLTLVPQAGSSEVVKLCVSSAPTLLGPEDGGVMDDCATREYKIQGDTDMVIRFATSWRSPLPCETGASWVAGEFLDGGGTPVVISGTYNGPSATPWADGTYTRAGEIGTFRIAQ